MKKNMHVSTHTLEVFCNILQCPVEDIVEVILDPQEPDGKEPSSSGSRAVGRTAAGARDAKKAEGVTGDKAPGKPASRSGVQGTGKAAAATRDNTSGKPASRSGVQGTGKAAAATRDNTSGKPASRSGVQGAGRPQQSPEKSQPERQKTVLAEKRLGRLRLVPERETSR